MEPQDYIKKGGYVEAVGRRKRAVARVRLSKEGGDVFTVNGKKVEDFFPTSFLVNNTREPFFVTKKQFSISAHVSGGGVTAQSDAIRHGISRCIVLIDAEDRKPLKTSGFLKRDPRRKERKKFGLRKARRAPQWSKR